MDVFPDFDGLDGIGDLRAVIGALLTFVLIVAVLMLIVSAIVWAIAAANGNHAMAGKGRTGILVAFIARQNPLAIIPVAILLGGIRASGGLLQRWHDLPDASVLVLQGIMFVMILAGESLHGRISKRLMRRAA